MRNFWRVLTCSLAVCAADAVARAHPGHGTTDPSSVTHYVLEPVHATPLVVIVLAVVAISLMSAQRRRSR
jgi:hypothetical protein